MHCNFFAWLTEISSILFNCQYSPLIIGDSPKQYVVSEVIYSGNRHLLDSKGELVIEEINLSKDLIVANTLYQISFDLDCSMAPGLLYVDFCGTDYDNPRQDFTFEIEPGLHTYLAICNSENIPEDLVVRLIYNTNMQYELKNFQIAAFVPSR